MKNGDTVYFVETNNVIREAEVINVSNDFVTLKYDVIDPHYISGGKGHINVPGGIRLRRTKVFSSRNEADVYLKTKKCNK